jgi:ATP-dependent protease HslVU (ClpYQ) peptidase subunit
MTVIAAKIEKNKIHISCDSQVSRGNHKKKTGFPGKIVTGSDFFVGVSGDALLVPLLTAYSKNHPIGGGGEERVIEWGFEFLDFCKKRTDSWEQEGELILCHHSGLFLIYDWLPLKIEDFCAVGAGFQHAEAAMCLGKSTHEAVDVAINLAFGCGGDITTENITLGT